MQFIFDNWLLFLAFGCLFLVNTVVQYRLGHNQGFSEGSTAGFQVGVAHSSLFVCDNTNKDISYSDALATMNKMVNSVPLNNPEYDNKLTELCLKHTLNKVG